MRKTILTLIGSALLVTSTVQFAAAAEHHKARRTDRAAPAISQQVLNSNAYAAPVDYGWSRYENGAASAPAGR